MLDLLQSSLPCQAYAFWKASRMHENQLSLDSIVISLSTYFDTCRQLLTSFILLSAIRCIFRWAFKPHDNLSRRGNLSGGQWSLVSLMHGNVAMPHCSWLQSNSCASYAFQPKYGCQQGIGEFKTWFDRYITCDSFGWIYPMFLIETLIKSYEKSHSNNKLHVFSIVVPSLPLDLMNWINSATTSANVTHMSQVGKEWACEEEDFDKTRHKTESEISLPGNNPSACYQGTTLLHV